MALWTPAQLAPLVELDDTCAVTVETGVSIWADKSGNGRNAVQATAANQPALVSGGLNGKNVIQFDAVNDFLLISGVPAQTAVTGFVVVKATDPQPDVYNSGLWGYSTASLVTMYPGTNGSIYDNFASSARKTTVNPTPSLGDPRIYSVESAAGSWKNRLDGVQLYSTTSNIVTTATGIYLGRTNGSNVYFLDGYIAAFLLLAGIPTDDNRQRVEGFYAWNFGLQGNLAADHPYKDAAPTILDPTIHINLDQLYNFEEDLICSISQSYDLRENLLCFIEQPYILTLTCFNLCQQQYGLQLLITLTQHYGDAKSITKFLEQYYSSSRNIIKILEQVYGKEIRTIVQLQQAFTLIGNIVASSDHSYSITEHTVGAPLKLSQNYNLELLNSIVSGLRQNWNITSNILLNNTIDYKVTISGVQVPSENVNVNCDIEQHYIEGTFTLHKPDYFPLCIKKANVVITITVGSDTKEFHLLLWEKTRTTTVNSTIYTLTCRSQSVLLDSKYSPTLQKEFPANLASTTVVELAAIHSIPVSWNVYESGQLVDELIPAGYLFANNEKPLAVIRKILEPLGAIMQSTPAGGLEIMHVYPKKVPSYQTETVDIDLKQDIRYENVSTTSEERSGVNTVYVSDQLTANSTYNLEEEVVSSIAKYVKGFHTPWDSEEVYLDTSGGTSVLIEYLGVVTENMHSIDSEVPYELIEFVNGSGHVSKPIYVRNTIEWVMDSLGGITFAEDGTLTSEIPGESLLKITYTTKYHKWLVTSPNIKDVQCILRPVHE